jgi:hypothetical protein
MSDKIGSDKRASSLAAPQRPKARPLPPWSAGGPGVPIVRAPRAPDHALLGLRRDRCHTINARPRSTVPGPVRSGAKFPIARKLTRAPHSMRLGTARSYL